MNLSGHDLLNQDGRALLERLLPALTARFEYLPVRRGLLPCPAQTVRRRQGSQVEAVARQPHREANREGYWTALRPLSPRTPFSRESDVTGALA